ncbi:methylmalonyl-CoA decarboxylase [Desulfobulbus sp.]|uniref:methylmalonyl-CoA decarboxylase n=1 Tax=Desulfobulbus sp. TaxID=895 RepID=UPI00286F4247|nr:methylmalonyl-CoA decarboxylase [Desulfobulbus sp.]
MILVHTELDGKLGFITLNNAPKRNCLSKALIDELVEALDQHQKSGALAVVLRAPANSTVWSAGHDIGELPDPYRDPLPYEEPFESLLRHVQDYPRPIIAMVEGGVWGGALDLALSCDILIGCENATFAITPAKIGVPYNPSGLIHFINILGLNKAKELFFTAQPISAQEALRIGLLNHLVPAAELEAFTKELAAKIINNAPLTVSVIKRQFRLLTRGATLTAETFELIQSVRRNVYDSQDYQEGIRAFKEKRPPRFQGK